MKNSTRISGFTLIEMALVILVIAIIVTGYFGTAEFIQASKQSRLISDIKNLSAAYTAFQSKYDAPPGDFRDAVSFFGAGTVQNGNGDGLIRYTDGGEAYNSFLMLKLADIYGVTTNLDPAAGDTRLADRGIYLPNCRSISDNCAMSLSTAGDYGVSSLRPVANSIVISGYSPTSSYSTPPFSFGALPPSVAESVDQKLDDGQPLRGLFRIYEKNTLCGTGNVRYRECAGVYPLGGITSEENWNDTQKYTVFLLLEQD